MKLLIAMGEAIKLMLVITLVISCLFSAFLLGGALVYFTKGFGLLLIPFVLFTYIFYDA